MQPQRQPQALHTYDGDVIEWANEQAALLRARRFDLLDIEHLADEIEDVGKSEKRELDSRMVVLVMHLLKWKYQPGRRGISWESSIEVQRERIAQRLRKTPSLKTALADSEWLSIVWRDARSQALNETQLEEMPKSWIWTVEQVLNDEFWPD